jgi:CO/xanthine dehydrogenase Mo-binding subunit
MTIERQTVIGASIKRLEDNRLLRGRGRFVDDVQLPHMLHAAVLRSPHPHAGIVDIDLSTARRWPGVVDILTFEDIAGRAQPIPVRLNPYGSLEPFLQFPLARDRVRYAGEPVALIIAESRYRAEDALEHIHVRYEPLPVVVDAETAPATILHDAAPDNVASHFVMETGDVVAAFEMADHIIEARFVTGRHSGVPLETRGLVAYFDAGQDRLCVWGPTKVTHFNRGVLARMLNMPEHRIQFIEPDVGGSFGVRGEFYPEDYLVPFAALRLGRPIKWIEDRLENLIACNHSRQQIYRMALALQRDGTILGAKVDLINDMGAYIRTHGVIVPELSAGMFPGPYRLPSYHCQVRCVLTNKTPTGTYRAPGRFEANAARERLIDLAAGELGLDPVDLRMKNLIPPDAMPHPVGTCALGEDIVYDSGDYPYALQEALRLSDYTNRKAHCRPSGSRQRGVGVACFVEKTGLGPFESGRVEIDPTGHVVVSTGAAGVGQGIETVLAQIAAQVLTVPPETITVRHGDTDLLPYGGGSFASRGTVMAGNAVYQAAQQVRGRLLNLAARALDVSPESLELRDGRVQVLEDPNRTLTLAQVAGWAHPRYAAPGEDPGLAATCYFRTGQMTYSHGVTVTEVEVDTRTGAVIPQHAWIVYDVGTAINPQAVAGQIEGGAAQGLGGALLEEFDYDSAGQLLSGTFMDYLLPTCAEIPPLTLERLDRSPSPLNPLGVKGAGECGIAGMGGALANAVADALGPAGRRVDTLPMTPERVWSWLQ